MRHNTVHDTDSYTRERTKAASQEHDFVLFPQRQAKLLRNTTWDLPGAYGNLTIRGISTGVWQFELRSTTPRWGGAISLFSEHILLISCDSTFMLQHLNFHLKFWLIHAEASWVQYAWCSFESRSDG